MSKICNSQNIEKKSKIKATLFSVQAEIKHPFCGLNNGIIKINTDAESPTFEWLNNELSIDSIAYNLTPGSHSVRITDIYNNQVTYLFSLEDYQNCSPLNAPNFSYEILPDGLIKISTNEDAYLISQWDMGDDILYENKTKEFYHKYSAAGTYNVCLTISRNGLSQSNCQSINIPSWSTSNLGVNILTASSNYSINNLIVKKACDCGNLSYLFASSQTSTLVKLYKFDSDTETATLLPIDELFGGINANLNYECYNNKLYFSGRVGTSGFELCESDGSINGTHINNNFVTIENKGINPNNFKIFNNSLYFDGLEQGNYYIIGQTFKLNGNNLQKLTSLGISGFGNNRIINDKMIHNSGGLNSFDGNINQLLTPLNAEAHIYDELNGKVIFIKSRGIYDPGDDEIWSSDGSAAGTFILKDIRPGEFPVTSNYSHIKSNNLMFFVANDGITGHELWVTDGTESGTKLLKDIYIGNDVFNISDFVIFNNKVYFLAASGPNSIVELWSTDGTINGTQKVPSTNGKNIARYSSIENLFTDGNFLFFQAGNGSGYYFSAINNLNEFFQISHYCYNDNYENYKTFKLSNGKTYLNGKRFNQTTFYKTCTYNIPIIEDLVAYNQELITISQPLNFSIKIHQNLSPCSQFTVQNPYSFTSTQNKAFLSRVTNENGCETNPKEINVYTQYGYLSIISVARCNNSTVRVKFLKTGFFKPNTEFKIILVYFGNYEIPTTLVGDELIGEIPLNFQGSIIPGIAISPTSTSQIFSSNFQLPSVSNSLSAYILGTKLITPNSSATLTIYMQGNPPFNFSINGQTFSSNSNTFFQTVSPQNSLNYCLENFQNTCGTGIVRVNSAKISIAECPSIISQNGVLLNGIFKSKNSIESSGTLNAPLGLQYESEKSIILNHGFKVENGAKFNAIIKTCRE